MLLVLPFLDLRERSVRFKVFLGIVSPKNGVIGRVVCLKGRIPFCIQAVNDFPCNQSPSPSENYMWWWDVVWLILSEIRYGALTSSRREGPLLSVSGL